MLKLDDVDVAALLDHYQNWSPMFDETAAYIGCIRISGFCLPGAIFLRAHELASFVASCKAETK